MMHSQRSRTWAAAVFGIAILIPGAAWAVFNSGSTGADGAFVPTASVEVLLPPSGIFNFTTVNIAAGVTVTFAKNAANTPVVILATGDVTIAGTIDISGGSSQQAGGTNLGDHTLPGVGGPGGYDGGRGGLIASNRRAGNGLGPGGGGGGTVSAACCSSQSQGGGGGGYNGPGATNSWGVSTSNTGIGGASYGTNLLLPLIGGSGGGGGAGGSASQAFGSGGGGGSGAILIAANGTVTVTGSILARGGRSGNFVGAGAQGAVGGGGSGGAVRIVASDIVGNVSAVGISGGQPGTSTFSNQQGGAGASGRVSFEVAQAGTVFVAGLPTLRITSVAGVATPAQPTGQGDITLPADTPNPVTVTFETTGVPITNTVRLTMTPLRDASTTVVSPTLTGSTALATTSVSVDLPAGPSTLFATTSFSIVASVGDALSRFAAGERVEQIDLAASLGGPPFVTLVTVSGKKYTVPYSTIAATL